MGHQAKQMYEKKSSVLCRKKLVKNVFILFCLFEHIFNQSLRFASSTKLQNDKNTVVFVLQTVTPQPMNLTVIQSIEKLSVQWKAQYSIIIFIHFSNFIAF